MNKKGLSEVVTTLIIILIALVAIAAVWLVISNMISKGSSQIGLEQFSIDINFISASRTTEDISLTVKRAVGAGNMTGLKFIISDGSNSEEFTKEGRLLELQEKTFVVVLTSLEMENVETVSVAPIFIRNGEEVLGAVTDTYTFEESSIEEGSGTEDCIPECNSGYTCNHGDCVPVGCVEPRVDAEVCNDEGAICGMVQDICGEFVNCDIAVGGCGMGDICNNGICVDVGCTESRTDIEVCNDEEFVCGIVHDSCGNFVDCDIAIGGCSSGQICNNGMCVLEGCIESRTDIQICGDENAECGNVRDNCGDYVDCDIAIGGCVPDIEQCVLNSCEPLIPVSGTIDSVWPAGIAIYFDSFNLPTDEVYSGYYAKFLPPSMETECLLVEDYDFPQPPQTKVIVRLQATETSVSANDNVQLWPTYASCIA
jgi:flagellin-like protein